MPPFSRRWVDERVGGGFRNSAPKNGKFQTVSLQEKIIVERESIIPLLLERAEKKGDLPIFNASLNNVRRISSDRDAHAMELAQTIMKDANLSVKLLRIANSPYYNRGMGKISSVSRAVVLLGFEHIKNLCLTLKLIESFNDEHPTVGFDQMVARSYLTAGFVQDISMKCGVKNAEESYISGLCHNIGEIAVGYFLPSKFNEMIDLQRKSGQSWRQVQDKVLGMPLATVGQKLAQNWNFSSKVINSMREYNPDVEGAVRNSEQLNHAMVSLSSQVIGSLYLKHQESKKPLRRLVTELSEATGIKSDQLEKCLTNALHRSCELTKEYGLSQRVLQPTVKDSGDHFRDNLAREFSFYIASQMAPAGDAPGDETNGENKNTIVTPLKNKTLDSGQSEQPATHEVDKGSDHQPPVSARADAEESPVSLAKGDPTLQLAVIQEITALVTESASLSKLFLKILEGLHRGVGFDRALLCLVTPNRGSYAGRIAMGPNGDELQRIIAGPIDEKNDIFSRILNEGGDLLVEDVAESSWKGMIKQDFTKQTGATSFIIAGISSRKRTLGFFYGDNGSTLDPITPEMRRGFLQFIAQARLAVQVCG